MVEGDYFREAPMPISMVAIGGRYLGENALVYHLETIQSDLSLL
jgi:hypothetical protein